MSRAGGGLVWRPRELHNVSLRSGGRNVDYTGSGALVQDGVEEQ